MSNNVLIDKTKKCLTWYMRPFALFSQRSIPTHEKRANGAYTCSINAAELCKVKKTIANPPKFEIVTI